MFMSGLMLDLLKSFGLAMSELEIAGWFWLIGVSVVGVAVRVIVQFDESWWIEVHCWFWQGP